MTLPKLNLENQFGEVSENYILGGIAVGVNYEPAANPYAVVQKDQLIIAHIDNQVINLPAATGSGREIVFLVLSPSTVINVYPYGTDQINNLGPGSQLQIFVGNPSARIVDAVAGKWFQID